MLINNTIDRFLNDPTIVLKPKTKQHKQFQKTVVTENQCLHTRNYQDSQTIENEQFVTHFYVFFMFLVEHSFELFRNLFRTFSDFVWWILFSVFGLIHVSV